MYYHHTHNHCHCHDDHKNDLAEAILVFFICCALWKLCAFLGKQIVRFFKWLRTKKKKSIKECS